MADPRLCDIAWPVTRIGEAIQQLAERAGFPLADVTIPPPPAATQLDCGRWIEAVAASLALEAKPVDAPDPELEDLLVRAAPALVVLPEAQGVLVVVGRRGARIAILSPTLRVVTRETEPVADAMRAGAGMAPSNDLDGLLATMALSERQRGRARAAIRREQLRTKPIGGCFLIRVPPSASFAAQARIEGLLGKIALLVGVHGAEVALGVVGWLLLGSGAFAGHLERGWLVAWALLLLTLVPLRLVTLWLQGELAIAFGKLLKRRLLLGALKLDPDVIRSEGAGQLLARTLETNTIEGMALNAGIGSILALAELVVVVLVLGLGSGGKLEVGILVFCLLIAVVVGVRAYRRTARWTDARRNLTHATVERMVGHRTRLAQQDPGLWHEGEDESVERYVAASRAMDRSDLALQIVPYAAILAGIAGLAPGFIGRTATSGLAVGLGGVLLAGAALTRLVSGLMQATTAAIGWRQVGPLYAAAATPRTPPSPTIAVADVELGAGAPRGATSVPLVSATSLGFTYPGRPEPVLDNASLRIDVGDRLLLEGPSGGGKSTLAAILAGLRQPSSGLLLLDGLDAPTLGEEGWRRRVASAPQYHDNHILGESLGFNLLFGRRWPPKLDDALEALEICRELGLGGLIDRMPAGLMQIVGETGWRLSHGERSRVFIARALLQRARLIVLDESFAALDPETLEQCLRCVLKRAPSLLVIAHP